MTAGVGGKRDRRRPRIAVVGNLANVGYRLTKSMRDAGMAVDFFPLESDFADPTNNPLRVDPDLLEVRPDWLRTVGLPRRRFGTMPESRLGRVGFGIAWRLRQVALWREFRQYDLIQSVNIGYLWLNRVGRPHVALATGFDLRELSAEQTDQGRRAAEFFKDATVVLYPPDRKAYNQVQNLGLVDAQPNFLQVDTQYFSPEAAGSRSDSNFVIFHPTRLDWTDSTGRTLKANDRIFRAVAGLKSRGIRAEIHYLERGYDVDATRMLISELDIGDRVTAIRTSLDDERLRAQYRRADVVADQFDLGSLGLVCLEAMSSGTPVLVDIDPEYSSEVYGRRVPVFHARSVADIAEHVSVLIEDRALVRDFGSRSREFVLEFHSSSVSNNRLLKVYSRLLGCPVEKLLN